MTGLRDEKRAQTTRLLAETSFRLAVEHGVDGFTIDEVTTATGYSRRTFANHFSCKEEAIAEVAVLTAAEGLAGFRIGAGGESLIDALERAVVSQLNEQTMARFVQLVSLAQRHPTLQPFILATRNKMMTLVTDVVARARGGAPADLDTVLLLRACYGMLDALFTGEVELPSPGDRAPHPRGLTLSIEEFVRVAFGKLRTGF